MWRQEAEERDESVRRNASVARGGLMRAMQSHPQQQPFTTMDDAKANFTPRRNGQMDRTRAPIASQQEGSCESSAAAATPRTQESVSRNRGDRTWGARIRASIARLMEIDGVCLDPESYAKSADKRKDRETEVAFHAKVDLLQTASEAAHKEYWERLRDVYSVSTAKKMRLTTAEPPSLPAAATASSSASANSWQPRHEALNTLAVAAATEQLNEPEAPMEPTATKVEKTQRSSRRQTSLALEDAIGTERNPIQIHDSALAKAVDKLAGNLAQLLGQLQATSDAAAAEPILAAAATIALEATEMRRSEEVALTRMTEIEEHRQEIMKGLLEYAKRKEQREMDENSNEHASSASDLRDSSTPPQHSGGKADEKQT